MLGDLRGLDFILTALFIVLALDAFRERPDLPTLALALGVAVAITILAVYCLSGIDFTTTRHDVPEAAGAAVSIVVHLWRHNAAVRCGPSLPLHRDLAHRGDSARAPREARPEEPVHSIDVVGFDDQEERVLGIRPVATDQCDAIDIGVVQGVGAALVSRAELRGVNLRDVEQH